MTRISSPGRGRKWRMTAAALICAAACAHLASAPLNGRWDVPGMGEVRIRFGLMTISDPSARAFSDASSTVTVLPISAWSWNGTIYVLPMPFAEQFGRMGGPSNNGTPILPVSHNMRPGSMNRIDQCTLSVYSGPKVGPWRRIDTSCPPPDRSMRESGYDKEFAVILPIRWHAAMDDLRTRLATD